MGRGYIHSDISVGSCAEIAAALPAEAAWKVWEDPKYEHLGEVHLNHPDLGVFVADCDAQGHPVFTSEEIDRLIERTDADRVQLGHLTGRTWEIALEQLDAANKGIVIPATRPRVGATASGRAQPARVGTVAVDAGRRAGADTFADGPSGSRPSVRSAAWPVASPGKRARQPEQVGPR